MPEIKEIKKDEEDEEASEEQLEELEEFVEQEIQNPNILRAEDVFLQSGETLPQTPQLEQDNLEQSVEDAPATTEGEEEQTNYETVEGLYEESEKQRRQQNTANRVIRTTGLIDTSNVGIRNMPTTGDRNFQQIRMMEPEAGWGGGGMDEKKYEVGSKKTDTQTPFDNQDERLKKYKPRR